MALLSSSKVKNFRFLNAARIHVSRTFTVPSAFGLNFLSVITDKKFKPNAEGTVGNISTWITAALRDEQFFSLAELNHAIREKLQQFNRRLFQKKEGSRFDLFLEDEKPLLAPLPATRFELSDWKTATVQFNYHIFVDGMLCSVPYEYIKKKVDVKVTDTTIKIFYNHNRTASHRR